MAIDVPNAHPAHDLRELWPRHIGTPVEPLAKMYTVAAPDVVEKLKSVDERHIGVELEDIVQRHICGGRPAGAGQLRRGEDSDVSAGPRRPRGGGGDSRFSEGVVACPTNTKATMARTSPRSDALDIGNLVPCLSRERGSLMLVTWLVIGELQDLSDTVSDTMTSMAHKMLGFFLQLLVRFHGSEVGLHLIGMLKCTSPRIERYIVPWLAGDRMSSIEVAVLREGVEDGPAVAVLLMPLRHVCLRGTRYTPMKETSRRWRPPILRALVRKAVYDKIVCRCALLHDT